MKKFLWLIFLALYGVNAFPVYYPPSSFSLEKSTSVGKATYVLQYSLKFKNSSKQKDYDVDDRIVQVGDKYVKDYSHIIFYYDSLTTENDRKGLDSPGNQNHVFPYELLIDVKARQCDMKYRLPLNGGTLCYHSELPQLEWTFLPDSTSQILGYTCCMAKTYFAGRNYVAWYAVDIPIPYGPYKFSGLPGLIMKIEDASRQFIWELVGMQNQTTPIAVYQYEGEQKCTEQEARNTIGRAQRNPVRFLEQLGRRCFFQSADGRVRPSTSVSNIPDNDYEPLEIKSVNARTEENSVKMIPLSVDSMPKAKVIQEMQIVDNRLCLIYEHPARWGSQLLRTFRIVEPEKKLVFDYEYLRNPAKSNGIDYPLLFEDSAKHSYIADKTYPLVYKMDFDQRLMQNTHQFLVSTKSKVPYAIALHADAAYRCSDDESYFVGRQPKNGCLALYQSLVDSVSAKIKEVGRLCYSSKYPAWTVNFGKSVFSPENHKLAHGFYLFPAIQLIDWKTGQSSLVKLAECDWKQLKLTVGDVWDVNPMQVKDVTATRQKVYALWWGRRNAAMNALRLKNRAQCKLVVFDWKGQQMKTYVIPQYLSAITALADDELIATDGKRFYLLVLPGEE